MKKYGILILALTGFMGSAQLARADVNAGRLQEALRHAYGTENLYVLNAGNSRLDRIAYFLLSPINDYQVSKVRFMFAVGPSYGAPYAVIADCKLTQDQIFGDDADTFLDCKYKNASTGESIDTLTLRLSMPVSIGHMLPPSIWN